MSSSERKSAGNTSSPHEEEMDFEESSLTDEVQATPERDSDKDIESKEIGESKSETSPFLEEDTSEDKSSALTSSVEVLSSELDEVESIKSVTIEDEKLHDDQGKDIVVVSDSPSSNDKGEVQETKETSNGSESNLTSDEKSSPAATKNSTPIESQTDSREKVIEKIIPSKRAKEVSKLDSVKQVSAVQAVSSPGSENSSENILGISPKCDERFISDIMHAGKRNTKDKTSHSSKSKSDTTADKNTDISAEKPTTPGETEGDGKLEKSDKSPSSSQSKSEHKRGDGEKKKKKKKNCEECKAKKDLKFQVLFQGKTRFLCSDECFKNFKSKQNQSKATSEAPSTPKPVQNVPETCGNCKKGLTGGEGYYPEVGEIKPMCSDECVKKYEENKHPPKFCSQCKKMIEDRYNYLTWETMAYCNEDCLQKYQSFLGSQCTCCHKPVQQSSLGKYCVCFGSDIKQFCSGGCLEEFKKSLKVCTFCQTDLSSVDAFLAPVGEMGSFKDFCSQPCMVQYEVMNKKVEALAKVHDCEQCGKQGTFKIIVKYEEKWCGLCSSQCVAGFRYANKIKLNVCETCCKIIPPETELKYTLTHDGMHKNFCTRPCMTLYTLSNRKIIPCVTCKVKKYNFDMIEKFDKNEPSKVFCSLNCLSLYRVSLNVTSSKCVRCDHCTKTLPAQYHLTMSDGSVRNFCNYPCVLMFQNQFQNVPALTNITSSRQSTAATKTLTIASSTPVISNVMSLATPPPRTPIPTGKVVGRVYPCNPSSPIGRTGTKSQGSSPSYPSTPSSTVSSNPSGSTQVVREVIVKPPAPKSVKNKTVSCKPIMQTKGISCKPHPCHKAVQTDDRPFPLVFPFPLPMYIPVPLPMYSRPVPVPMPFGIPIPFPIVVPGAKEKSKETPSPFLVPSAKEIPKQMPSPFLVPTAKEKPKETPSPFLVPIAKERFKETPIPVVVPGARETPKPVTQASNSKQVNADKTTPAAEIAIIPEIVIENGTPNIIELPPTPTEEVISDQEDEYFFKDTSTKSHGKRSINNQRVEKTEKRVKPNDVTLQENDFPQRLPENEDQTYAPRLKVP